MIKGNLRSARTTLLDQAKGPSSPRLFPAIASGGRWWKSETWTACSVVLPKSALSVTRRQTLHELADLPRGGGPRSQQLGARGLPITPESPSWELWTNACIGGVQTTCTYKQLDLHFVLNMFLPSKAIQREDLLPLPQQFGRSKHYPRQSDFYKTKEQEARQRGFK